MKAQLSIGIIVALLGGRAALSGQAPATAGAPSRAQKAASASVSADHYLAKIVVHLRDGSAVFGYLDRLEPEALVVRKGTTPVRLAPAEMAKVTLEVEKNRLPFVLTGMLAGVYLGNLIWLHADNQPTAFIHSDDVSASEIILSNLVYAGGGIGLGFLASLFAREEKTFTFDESPAARLAEWEKFRDYVAGVARPKRAQLTLQTAVVFPSATESYADLARGAGYTTSSGYNIYSGTYYSYAEPAGPFNLLRGVRLTYGLNPRVEVGAAVMFLGEPGVGGYQYVNGFRHVGIKFDATGGFALAALNVLGAPGKVHWKVGLGAGAARVNFDIRLTEPGYSYPYSPKVSGHSFAKTVFCPLMFTELQFPVSRDLSLGVVADYALMPSESVPAFPDWGLPAARVRLGNASVGLSVGWRF